MRRDWKWRLASTNEAATASNKDAELLFTHDSRKEVQKGGSELAGSSARRFCELRGTSKASRFFSRAFLIKEGGDVARILFRKTNLCDKI